MALSLSIGKCTLLGNYRENNEDSIEVKQYPELTICVVADGMGGQSAGEIASKQAIEILPRELKQNLPGAADDEAAKNVFRQAVVRANAQIMEMATLDRDYANMGTTVVAVAWRKGSEVMYIASVGDSRCYLIRDGQIEQLTIDHSIAQALVEAKTISAAEARVHRYRNVLWKYLGSKEVGEGPEVKAVTIAAGDRFILCTDGVTGVVDDEGLLKYAQGHTDVQQLADGMGQFALDSGSRDNVSCVVVDVV